MNGKKLIFAVSALVLAVLIIVLGEQLGKKKPSEKSLQFFPGLAEKDISAFEITDASGKVRLQRKGDIWVIGTAQQAPTSPLNPIKADSNTQIVVSTIEYQVDSASLVSAVDKIVSIRKDQLTSKNPEKQSLFEVDSAKGVLVEIFDLSGKSKGSFRIGKNGPDYNSNYVRMTGSNDVYMVNGSVKISFFTDQERWRDKTIMKFDRNTAQSITITKKAGPKIVMVKDTGTTWSLKEPLQAQVKSSEVESMLSTLSRFTASDIDDEIAGDSAAGLLNPELVVTVAFTGGTSKNIVFGSKNADNQYRLRADGKEHIFLVGEYDFNNFDKKPDDLKEDPPTPADSIATAGTK